MREIWGPFAILILAALAYVTGAPATQGTPQTAPPRTASQKKPITSVRPQPDGHQSQPNLGALFHRAGMDLPPGGHVRVIIALVPDPLRSRMVLETDRAIEALVTGAIAAQYRYRTLFPGWALPERGSPTRPGEDQAAATSSPSTAPSRQSPLPPNSGAFDEAFGLTSCTNGSKWVTYDPSSPVSTGVGPTVTFEDDLACLGRRGKGETGRVGIMLFDNGHPDAEAAEFVTKPQVASAQDVVTKLPLIVLLVGDSPAAGLDQAALYRALRLSLKLKHPADSELLIMGPNYSGSYLRLATVLFEFRPLLRGKTVTCISGTATSEDERRKAEQISRAPSPEAQGSSQTSANREQCNCPRVHWMSFAPTRKAVVQALQNAFGWSSGLDLAHLSEDDTVYGKPLDSPEDLANDLPGNFYFYPRGIAYLRQYSTTLFSARPRLNEQERSASIPPRIGDLLGGTDLAEPYSGLQQEASLLSQVRELVRRLRADHVRNLVIDGSDFLDVLFLTRYVRERAPGIRIFLADADVLPLADVAEYPLEGIVTCSRFPIPSPRQFIKLSGVTASGKEYQTFPSDRSAGIFCATTMLLEGKPHRMFCGAPSEMDGGTSRDPIGADRLWIYTVSRNGPELLRPSSEIGVFRPADPIVSPTWFVAAVALVFIGFVHVGGTVAAVFPQAAIGHVLKKWVPRMYRVLARDPRSGTADPNAVGWWATYSLALLVLIVMVCVPALISPVPAAAKALGLVLLTNGVVIIVFLYQQRNAITRPATALLSLALALVITIYTNDASNAQMLALRSLRPDSGVSLAACWGLFVTAILVIAFHAFRRNFNWQRRPPGLSFLPAMSGLNCRKDDECLELGLQTVTKRSRHAGLAFLAFFFGVLGLPILTTQRLPDELLEGLPEECLTLLLLGLCLSGWVGVFVNFFGEWRLLKSYCAAFEALPVRFAATRLPKGYSWSPAWSSSGYKQIALATTRIYDLAPAILQEPTVTDEVGSSELRDEVQKLRERAVCHNLCHQSAGGPSLGYFAEMRSSLSQLDQRVATALLTGWVGAVASDTASRMPDSEASRLAGTQWAHHVHNKSELICQEYAALRVATVVHFLVLHLRNGMQALGSAGFFIIGALNVYAFRSRELIDICCLLAAAVTGPIVLKVLFSLDRDPFLTRLSSDEQDQNADRLGVTAKFLQYALPPAIPLIVAFFPGLGRMLNTTIIPLLGALPR